MKKTRTLTVLMLACVMLFTMSGMTALAEEAVQTTDIAQSADTGQITEAEEVVQTAEESHVLDYVYVDEDVIHLPETQNIAVGFIDENLVLESAVLHCTSLVTGEQFDIPSSAAAGNAVLFTAEYEEGHAEDTIHLDGMTWQTAGSTFSLEFASEGIDAGYTVTSQPEQESSQNTAENNGITVYSLDDNGEVIQQSGDETSAETTVAEVLNEVNGAEDGTAAAAKSRAISTKSGSPIVVICAGHDSTHTGARGYYGLKEEELTFKVAQYCKEALQRQGITVYLDRSSIDCAYPGTSTGYCLNQRVIDAAAKGASIFVDIHFNTGGGTGAEVYYPNKSHDASISASGQDLAERILSQLSALGLKDRGAKIRNCTTGDTDAAGNLEDYYTTNNLAKAYGMIGIIVEHAFLDNTDDAKKLQSESFLKQLGEADAAGIINHIQNSFFTDVPQGAWPYDEVQYVYDRGIMTGMTSNYFGTGVELSRAHFVTMLYRIEGQPSVSYSNKFPDVSAGQFFTNGVMWASRNDIQVVHGYDNGQFGPSDSITREQMVTMLYRYLQYKKVAGTGSDAWKSYPDASKVSGFAQEAVSWAVANGIIQGDQGKINPQKNTSRAEAATIIQRFCTKYNM